MSKAKIGAFALATLLLSSLAVQQAHAESFCVPGPDDRPEGPLQGALPQSVLDAGPFAGQWCGMRQVGQNPLLADPVSPSTVALPRGSFGDVQLFGHCAYASMRDPSNLALATTGTAVLDVRVPSNPIWLKTLRTPAMQRAYSALEIQQHYLVGAFKDFGPGTGNPFDIYDLSGGCLDADQPKFLSTTNTASGNHDGWLTPDTNTYYGIPFGARPGQSSDIRVNPNRIDVHVLDLTDKANPKQLYLEPQQAAAGIARPPGAGAQLPRHQYQRRRHASVPGALRRQQRARRQ